MVSKRIGLLTFLLWFVLPGTAFGQIPAWLDISPGAVYQSPGDPSCYTITVGDGAYMTVDLLYTYEGGGPQEIFGWPTLDGNGQAVTCVDASTAAGQYVFVGVRNTDVPWWGYTPAYANLSVFSPPPPPPAPPVIYSLGSGGDNWDAIWIAGAHFQPDSYVYVYAADWSASQLFWGPAWGYSPNMWVAGDGSLITLQVTDPTVRNSFGNSPGVYVLVVNPAGTNSGWEWTQSPRPSISSGDAGCDDLRCLWMTGSFPLNAVIDLRVHGQSDVLPNSYTGLTVTLPWLAFRLNPSVQYAYDTVGLDAWVVNTLFPNWSGGYYFPPKDRAVTGHIDGISLSGYQYYLNGWACAKTYSASIDVHVYLGGPAGAGGTFAFSGTANNASEPNISTDCNSTGSHFRFSIPIPALVALHSGGQPIYVHGISPFGLGNSLIGNSGTFSVPAVDGSVTGYIDGVVLSGTDYYLQGWACAKTYPGSIDIQVVLGPPADAGSFAFAATATVDSEPGLAAVCNSTGAHYRFWLLLSVPLRTQFGGRSIYVNGVSPFGLPDVAIANSGNFIVPGIPLELSREYIYLGNRVLAVDGH